MTVSDVAALNYRDARLRLEACGYRYVGRYYPPLDGALPGKAEQVDGLPCRRLSIDTLVLEAQSVLGVVCGRGRNPTLRLWPTIFSGKIDVFPGDRRSRLISSMTSVAPA